MEIKKVLVSQPKPSNDKSPYYDIGDKYGVEVVFRPFIKVEGLTAKEFRQKTLVCARWRNARRGQRICWQNRQKLSVLSGMKADTFMIFRSGLRKLSYGGDHCLLQYSFTKIYRNGAKCCSILFRIVPIHNFCAIL